MPKEKIKRLLCDPHARGVLFLYGGAAFHFLYAVYRLFAGVFYRGEHIDAAFLFYGSLAVNRLSIILAYHKRHAPVHVSSALVRAGRFLFLTAGCMLLLLAETIAGARRPTYPRIAIFVSGGYAMLSTVLAALELLYLKRLGSPLLSASRAVGLASTLLSGFTFLEDLLFSLPLFSEAAKRVFLLSLGAAILLFVLFFALGLVYAGKRQVRGNKKRNPRS